MHKFKKLIHKHKEIFSFAIFVTTTLTVLTITLILVRTNQDVRSRASSGTCTLDNEILIDLVEQEFMEILNNHRATLNAGPLRLSKTLSRAAQWQAEDMIKNNYFNHVDSLGRTYQQRSLDCGASPVTGSENLANGAVSAQAAFNAWQASTDGHKENMENPIWSQTGISRVVANGQARWVQTFSVGNDGTSPDLEDPNTNPTPTNTPTPTSPTEPINCGTQIHTDTTTDFTPLNCAIEAANTCQSTLIGIDQTMNRLGLVTRGVTDYDFNKNLDGKCSLHFIVRLQDVLEFPSYWSDEDKEKLTSMQDELEETEGVCVFNQNNDLVNFLNITKNETWTGDADPDSPDYVFKNAQCSGSFFDTINDFILIPTPIASLTPNPTLPVGQVTVNLSFKTPGIGPNTALGENPNPYGLGRGLTLEVLDSRRKVIENRNLSTELDRATYTYKGSINLAEALLMPDNYIRISIPRARSHEILIKSIAQRNPLNIPTLLFRLGDFNNDGFYDLNDYIDLVSCIKRINCQNGGEYYDLNLDGKVDIVDLNILYRAIRDFNQ